MDDNSIIPSNRVFQLESKYLDNELSNTIDSLVDGLHIPKVSEFVKLLSRLYISLGHLNENTTPGMKLYNMEYYSPLSDRDIKKSETSNNNQNDSAFTKLSPKNYKLLLVTASNIVLPFLFRRSEHLNKILFRSPLRRLQLSWLNLENLLHAGKIINIINFLFFLADGKQIQLLERVLNVMPGLSRKDYSANMTMNKVQMELLNRQTVWKELAEFLTNVVPHINTEKIKNQVYRTIGYNQKTSHLKLSDQLTSLYFSDECGICGKQPYNAHVIGCKHVFCYYCLYSNYLIDTTEGFSCSKCNYKTTDLKQVQRFRTYN